MATAAGPGTYLYDPFGQPLDKDGFAIGTNSADEMGPGNTATSTTANGWEGSAQKQYQRAGDIATIEMGARQYVPGLGRFLSMDPSRGGNSNDYNYPNDPVNMSDLNGEFGWGNVFSIAITVAAIVGTTLAVAACAASVVCGIAATVAIGVAAGVASYAVETKPSNYTVSGFVTAGAVGGASSLVAGGVARLAGKVAFSSARIGADSKLFGNWTIGTRGIPKGGGALNNAGRSVKLGWGVTKGARGVQFRVSSKSIPFNLSKSGTGHISILYGGKIGRN